MKKVIKRDNRLSEFNADKIRNAIIAAAQYNQIDLSLMQIDDILKQCIQKIEAIKLESIAVEQIQDIVVESIKECGYDTLAALYQNYREQRTKLREHKSDLMKKIIAIGVETDRDNANVGNNFSAKLLRIASEANK